jgi:alpha-ketoglutarate-dependent taurine dioxygenase
MILTEWLKVTLDTKGWALIQNAYAHDDLVEVAAGLGEIIPSFPGEPLVDDLIYPNPKPDASWLSFEFPGTQPWHTDCPFLKIPPRYCILQCIGADNLVYTDLASPYARLTSSLRQKLSDEAWRVVGGGSPALIKVLTESERIFRYQPNAMRPLFHSSSESVQHLQRVCNDSIIASPVLKAADLLVFDNWRLLHRRRIGDVSTGRVPGRHIRRVLIR